MARAELFGVLLLAGVLLAGCVSFQPPSNVFVQIAAPDSVASGQAFNVTILIQNSDSREHRLDSIDLPLVWLKGMDVVGVFPPSYDHFDLAVVDQRTYSFNTMLPADSDVGVVFTFAPQKAGTFYGPWSVCIDGGASCRDQDLRILVN
ncbi:hypothetical protein HYV43_01465 [Candidatus Micrarchaeota archaeon]|nr:hypothetical protein [Candidatus Micrarchaeota archaeon]